MRFMYNEHGTAGIRGEVVAMQDVSQVRHKVGPLRPRVMYICFTPAVGTDIAIENQTSSFFERLFKIRSKGCSTNSPSARFCVQTKKDEDPKA